MQRNVRGPNEQAYALLECFAEYPSAPQLGQLSGHELNGVVGEVDLPAAPNKAVLKLAPQWRKRKAPPRQTYLVRYLGRVHTEGRPQKGRLCGASKPATHAPGEAKKRQRAATRMPRNGPQNGTLYSDSVKRRQGDVPWDAMHRTLQL